MTLLTKKPIDNLPPRPFREEVVNTATHVAGAVLSLIGGYFLVPLATEIGWGATIAVVVYIAAMTLVYSVSAISHAVQRPHAKYVWQRWDQGLIYFMIVGTYTPYVWSMPAWVAWPTLVVSWALAFAGFASKVMLHYRVDHAFSTATYIGLGWVPGLLLVAFVSPVCLAWTAAGGVSYTVGTLFLMNDRRHGLFHAAWHLFVIAGSALQYYAIYVHVIGPAAAA